MLAFLKNHPFAVNARFESSLVLSFAVPKEELLPLIPACLELDTYDDKWGFVAAALVQTKSLRPKGFPRWMGNDFFLMGYRVFVRYTTSQGKRLRGLFILKSETDKKKMRILGNLFTHYNYTSTDVSIKQTMNQTAIRSARSGLNIIVDDSNADVSLPAQSPFPDWKAARRFAGPLPFTFTFNSRRSEVLIIEGVRENWTPKPVEVINYSIDFVNSLGLKGIVLANAFIVKNIPYTWKKGRVDQWKH